MGTAVLSPADAGESLAALALANGSRLGQFKIQSLIGAGSFGITYRAVDLRLRRHVAIKEYCPRKFARRDADGATVRPRMEKYADVFRGGMVLFLNESRLLARFSHPGVVRVTQLFNMHDTAYIVMELERGASLQTVLAGSRRMNTLRVSEVFQPLLEGLRTIHEQSVLHCDISPNNIILREDGSAVLIDFGAARVAWDSDLAIARSSIYTRAYAAPEIRQGKYPTGPWTDIYGLGAVMFRCLTGEPPPPPELRRPLPGIALDGVDPVARTLAPLRSSPPEALAESVRWMLEPDPARRPQSVAEVAEALHCIDAGAVRDLSRRPRSRTSSTRRPAHPKRASPRLASIEYPPVQANADSVALLRRRLERRLDPQIGARVATTAARVLNDEQILDCVAALRSAAPECGDFVRTAAAQGDSNGQVATDMESVIETALRTLADAGRAVELKAALGQ